MSIVNESLLSGIFPDKLKLAEVTPVFKKGSTQDKDNYRPISVLSVFSKIFEKVMYKRLYAYLEFFTHFSLALDRIVQLIMLL